MNICDGTGQFIHYLESLDWYHVEKICFNAHVFMVRLPDIVIKDEFEITKKRERHIVWVRGTYKEFAHRLDADVYFSEKADPEHRLYKYKLLGNNYPGKGFVGEIPSRRYTCYLVYDRKLKKETMEKFEIEEVE